MGSVPSGILMHTTDFSPLAGPYKLTLARRFWRWLTRK